MSSCKCQCSGTKDERYLKLDEIIAKYKGKPGALIPVLHQAQEIFGYLPEDVQIYVAKGLDVPVSEVSGVVTFYSFFSTEPKGKYTIGVCMGTACYVKGADKVVEKLKDILDVEEGGTTADGKFTLQITRCLGACGLAPVMTIGDDIYGRLTPDKIPEILKKYD
ncbi:NADH dehydrogenase [Anoxybacter fermentans]|uniref:NADH dehydrogenase n=1 Tax=Anoxybacter fermentans TaxID=1323375 RepID=A0A3S9SYW4_9FIRM|nr:NADH-quinone oxidoreductase subunit NuoE [Anoxybacter fermentans]AZR73536.1 NADH dehydrogenase [Anoxybacter fermentans]